MEELQELERMLLGSSPETAPPSEPEPSAGAYQTHLDRARNRQRKQTEESQEIGPLPDIADPVRRESCRHDLERFALTYCRRALTMPDGRFVGLAGYQREMFACFQEVILQGGKKCRAVRRGGLKSTAARIACVWAVVYGHRSFPVLVGASNDKSEEHRDNVLDLLKASTELQDDFPELIPLLMKRDNPKKQLRLDGRLLRCMAKDARGCILFPDMPGVDLSGARIAPYSIESTDVSGLSFVDGRGRTVRPDLLLFDDVQTPQSAASHGQTSKRENAVTTTFMGLAGLGQTIAAIMVCTVRRENDLTERFCSRKIHPDWDGLKSAVLLHEPTDKAKWAIYAEKLRGGDSPQEGFDAATAWYIEHRAAMDEGGVVAWEEDKETGYVSALQWCMTKSILEPEYFRCELQQKGEAPKDIGIALKIDDIVCRLSRVPRGVVPSQASYLTAFVDSSDKVLWWMVCAWSPDFTGWIVDYGTWPDQQRAQFYKSDLAFTIADKLTASWEECFAHAHNSLDEMLLGARWKLENESVRQVDLMLKDWSDGGQARIIGPQVAASQYRSRIRPSKAWRPKPGRKPVHLWGSDRDRRGSEWIEIRTDTLPHVHLNSNSWKSQVARRLQTVPGAPGALLLPGDDELDLTLIGEHLTSEVAKTLVYDGIPGVVWEPLPGRDNDWWDCLVGNAVAASMLGCAVAGEKPVKEEPRKTVRFSDLQRARK